MTVDDDDEEDDLQSEVWETLYDKIVDLMHKWGVEDHFGHGDYLIVDDNYGWERQTIEVHKLTMLRVEIVEALQALLRQKDLLQGMTGWEIVIALDIPGTEGKWPPMGVTIRAHEIIDGLQRQYLPAEFKDFKIPGSRPGTGYD